MSRIKRVTLTRFEYPVRNVGVAANGFDSIYKPNFRGKGVQQVVTIETDDGVRGEYMGGTALMMGQMQYLAPHLIGADAFQRELLHDEFKRALRKYDKMGVGPLDNCLWDWAGKKLGCSVSQLLGAHKSRIKAYASTYHGDDEGGLTTAQDYVDFAEHCYTLGYRAFKAHGWTEGDAAREVEMILLLGEKVGHKMALMYDSACHLKTFSDAVWVGRACDQAKFLWYEDPYRDTGISAAGHRKLRQLINTPLLIGEHVRGLEAKADFIVADGTDLVRVNPDYDMGITGAVKIAHLAEAMGIDAEVHSVGPAQRHCVAAFRNASYYELCLVGPKSGSNKPEIYRCGYSDALDAIAADGCVEVPQGPGMGVEYDWQQIEKGKIEELVYE